MKNTFFNLQLAVLLCLVQLNLFSQNVGNTAYINVNKIYLPFNREGVIADVNAYPLGQGGHFEEDYVLYSAGFYLSGIIDSVWTNGVMPNVFVQDYQSGTANITPEDPRSAIYKLRSDDSPFSQSWQDWIDAVALGADFYDGDGNGIYNPVDLNSNNQWDPNEDKPDFLGDETYWCAFNDGVPMEERRWSVEPFGIEVKQTIFAFETDQVPLANTIFIRYKIVNTGTIVSKLDDIIFGHAYDADIGNTLSNLGGTDIGKNAHYCYGDSSCFLPGMIPLTFLTDFLAGPVSYIPGVSFYDINGNGTFENGIDVPRDTAYTFSGPLGVQVYIGATNLKMKAGVTYADGDVGQGEPWNSVEARNYLNGLQRRGAEADPCNYLYGEVRGGIDCHTINPYYWYSGDPVADVGWLNTIATENHAMFSLKPFDLHANQMKEIMLAYIVGTGADARSSVTEAKLLSDQIQEFYEDNFGYPIVLSNDEPVTIAPSTKISWQSPIGSWQTLKVYDLLGREVVTLVDEYKPAGNYEVEFDVGTSRDLSLSSGIYFYTLRAGDFAQTKKMILMK
ncbi:MAG: T9SS type A sorting domain-containing protein [Ignavibacteriaceae bacterium]|nr:T9SS type A sorting domain-containing protein [Ignavibacteriaceae bacterium]